MGNVNVMLRYSESEDDEPKYARVEIEQHIKWAQFRQLAFSSFQDNLGDGIDPQFLRFETRLDRSNIQVVIPDGNTLRGMFEDFYRMDKGGAPAIIDVLTNEEREDERDDSDSEDSSDDERDPEEVIQELMMKKKYRRKIFDEYKDMLYAEFKHELYDDFKDRLAEDKMDDMLESGKGRYTREFKEKVIEMINDLEL
eukprot:TRINITY_DN23957_c0_g1_i1.p2 TRINITY_DN23957_c0_g1~~TRINITY_DN23957_c0_g1_i1.p2  ORF type:complete len:197 (+),score=46.51 TRINITY_DN23957_c0_g1_i1:90-680(+)